MYAEGQGVTQNYPKAKYWYKKAAEQGNANAQNNLGVLYENGQGVTQNFTQAKSWFEKAAAQGNTLAQHALEYMTQQNHN